MRKVWQIFLYVMMTDKECTVSSGIQYITAIDDVELGKVSRVFEDKQGEEWVFSDKGVSIFGKRTISSYPFSMFETMDNLVILHKRWQVRI